MRSSLVWKLLAINVPVIGAVILVMWLAVDYLAADYFTVLMEQYNISPAKTHQMFVEAVHRYLVEASVASATVAGVFGFFLIKRVLRPLKQMIEVTRRVAAGDYSARTRVAARDEVGALGAAFNRMAESLERGEQVRRNMVVDVAHELRTPLTTIRGYLEALADGVVPPSKETFTMLESEILRLTRLVEDLGQLTRADAAHATLERREVMLPELIGQVLELYRPQFASRGIAVDTRLAPDAERVVADRDKIAQALSNLVQNACQYTPEGGTVTIATGREDGGVRLTVANQGEEIAAEHLPFIFERFYRADPSRSRESGGAGIGLAIVRGLIEAHGGVVGAASSDGHTRVWFTLPA